MSPETAQSMMQRLLGERAERLRDIERGAVVNQRRLADLLRSLGPPGSRPGRGG